MTGFTEKQRKALLTAGVTAAVYLSFKFILPLFLPFLISYLIALILRPSANFLERKLRVKRRGKTYAVPIGVIGGIEMILILALLGASLFPNSENSLLKMELYLLSLSSSISCRESIDAINRITVIIATFIKNPKTDTELTTRLGIVAFLNALAVPRRTS